MSAALMGATHVLFCQTRGPALSLGTVFLDADGDWAVTDEGGVEADGYFVLDADGELAIDDAAVSGFTHLFMRGTATVLE